MKTKVQCSHCRGLGYKEVDYALELCKNWSKKDQEKYYPRLEKFYETKTCSDCKGKGKFTKYLQETTETGKVLGDPKKNVTTCSKCKGWGLVYTNWYPTCFEHGRHPLEWCRSCSEYLFSNKLSPHCPPDRWDY
jgi:DnaJ-class molecular chaperone